MAVTNPLCPSRAHLLEEYGTGGAAVEYEMHKKRNYKDTDRSKYIFIPFVVETCGGMGAAAEAFCKELASRWQKKQCKSVGEMNADNLRSKLLCFLTVVIQRANSRMIIEVTPMPTILMMKRISQCGLAVQRGKDGHCGN